MDGTRSALIVASDSYTDPGLRRLRAPAQDAQALAAVLNNPDIGGFDARVLRNQPAHEINLAVEEFFADRRPDDLLLLHFSCHGVKDEGGELYFAAANTKLRRLGATAVAAEFVNRRMSRSRSRRVVLLLDCCYAGAFERGMTARAGAGMDIGEQFGGRGRAVITASSAMEYAFEGDELADISGQAPSVFTSALVEGLESGEADRDQDGLVALDELYDYVYDRVRAATPNQTPGKWTFGVQGELVIARRAHPVTTPAALPPELQEAVNSPFAGVRAGAVPELARLLGSRHAGLALAARQTLERLLDDDSRATSAAAEEALAAHGQAAPPLPPATAPTPAAPPPVETEVPEPVAATAPRAAEPRAAEPRAAEPPAVKPAAGAADRPARGRDDLAVRVAGIMALVSAVLLVSALTMSFQWDESLFDLDGKSVETYPIYVVTLALFALGAGTCMLLPTRRLIGSGVLLGVAAASTQGLLVLYAYPTDSSGGFGAGYRTLVAAHLLLILAAAVAGVALARSGVIRLRRPAPMGQLPGLMVLLGAAGAVALLFHVTTIGSIDGYPRPWIAVAVWWTVLALALPVIAALATPRLFGASLLLGWVGGGAAIVAAAYIYASAQVSNGSDDIGRIPILLGGLTLLPLLIVAVLHARAEPAPSADTAAPA
jgi:hypothetical protein